MRILVTAFEPYEHWTKNSSWETLVELLRTRGSISGVTTRRYPVDLALLKERLYQDLRKGFDCVLHLGQSPGSTQIRLEAMAINVAGMTTSAGDDFGELIDSAPAAYRSDFPLGDWSSMLRQAGIPASVSYHAGTYLCNALMYLSHHWYEQNGLDGRVGFIHLPLTNEQVLESERSLPSLPVAVSAKAIGMILDRILGVQQEFDFA